MNNNNTFSTSTTINDEYMVFPYNDHYSSQQYLPFSPSSSINDILIHSTSNTSNNHLDHHHDHHHQFLQPSPLSQYEFVPDFNLLDSLFLENNGNDDNQTIPNDNHHPSSHLLPLNNTIGDQPTDPSETITHIEDSQRISTFQDPKLSKVEKPSRTDRHSKIKTANGTRDRRMRLSVDVAKELFGLQDMLGLDKASKTIEWLLAKSESEIIKIKTLSHQRGFSSSDESHTRPALGSMNTSSDSNTNTTETRGDKVDGRSMRGKRKRPEPRTPILKKLSKDARAKARERAKDRTNEKMMKMTQLVRVVEEEAHDHGEIIRNNTSEVNRSSFEVMQGIEKLWNNDRFDEFVTNKRSHISNESYDPITKLNTSFPMLNYHRSQGAANFIEQQQQQQQHQFMDRHHFLGKPRDLMHNYQNMY